MTKNFSFVDCAICRYTTILRNEDIAKNLLLIKFLTETNQLSEDDDSAVEDEPLKINRFQLLMEKMQEYADVLHELPDEFFQSIEDDEMREDVADNLLRSSFNSLTESS